MIERLRRLLGDAGDPPAFSDARLAALLADAGDDLDRALLAGLQELRAEAAKQVNYSVGPDREEAGQLFDHLTTLAKKVDGRIAARSQGSSPARLGTIAVPVRVAY